MKNIKILKFCSLQKFFFFNKKLQKTESKNIKRHTMYDRPKLLEGIEIYCKMVSIKFLLFGDTKKVFESHYWTFVFEKLGISNGEKECFIVGEGSSRVQKPPTGRTRSYWTPVNSIWPTGSGPVRQNTASPGEIFRTGPDPNLSGSKVLGLKFKIFLQMHPWLQLSLCKLT